MKKLISYLCTMACVVVLAACAGGSDSPESVVEKYVSYVKSEQYDKILDITHFSKELTKEQKDEFVQMIADKVSKDFEKHGGLTSIEIESSEVAEDGTTAVVNTITHYGDGSDKKEKIKTVQVDGKWMLDSGK